MEGCKVKKIAGYYRLSIEDDDVKVESNSITNQRLLIKKYVSQDTELSQYEYCEFYDDGYSGTSMNRPGMQEMLEQIKNHEIQVVIVKDISRFSRDYIELGTYMEQIFPFMGIRFIAITDCYDSRNYTGQTADLDIAFKSLLADFYCKDVSEKVKSSIETKREQGKYATGLVPFGYAKDTTDLYKLVIVPEEAEVIRYIFRLSVEGNNLTQICKRLNDEGIMTPLEYKNLRKKQNRRELEKPTKFWQAGTVRSILTNENYIGNMVYNKTRQSAIGSGKQILKPRAEWKICENHHIPIVDRDMFAIVQKKFNQRKVTGRSNIVYPLRGKVFCGYCKRTLKVMKLAKEKLFFYCANEKISSNVKCITESFSNEELEKIVFKEIKKQLVALLDEDVILQEKRVYKEAEIKEQEKEVTVLEKQIQELTEQKSAYLEEYHDGNIDKEQFRQKSNEITLIINNMKSEQAKKAREIKQQAKAINRYAKECEGLLGYLGMEYLTREMVEAFIEHIEIDGNRNIDIHWTFNNRFDSATNSVAII